VTCGSHFVSLMSDFGSEMGAELWVIFGRDAPGSARVGSKNAVDIADIEAALKKVRDFTALLETSRRLHNSVGNPAKEQAEIQIQEQLPLIARIAERADPELVALLKEQSPAWRYHPTLRAARQLTGLLSSVEETEQILGPAGPKLAAANLHAWVWNAAVSLWDDGHRREAVQAAAQALFDSHIPAKLGVPRGKSAKDLIAQAFSTDPPATGSPRLRLPDHQEPSPDWTSQHEGARFFGMGCAQLIRNLVTHGEQPDEQMALEQLASLSLPARPIDRASVVT
jgi:hypothetical protein